MAISISFSQAVAADVKKYIELIERRSQLEKDMKSLHEQEAELKNNPSNAKTNKNILSRIQTTHGVFNELQQELSQLGNKLTAEQVDLKLITSQPEEAKKQAVKALIQITPQNAKEVAALCDLYAQQKP